MQDIGVVYYTQGSKQGILEAAWYSNSGNEKVLGTGLAVADKVEGYAGEYKIVYTNSAGIESEAYDLEILKVGSVYELTWSQQGSAKYFGVGLETPTGLAAGWRSVDTNS